MPRHSTEDESDEAGKEGDEEGLYLQKSHVAGNKRAPGLP